MSRISIKLSPLQRILVYGAAMGVLVFLLKWLQWKYLIADHSIEIYGGVLALIFTALGVWIANQWAGERVETVIVEKEVLLEVPVTDEVKFHQLLALNLTERELEVWKLVSKGYSNADIAATLFLSVSTIKTHVSNLLLKLDVKNRTQAAEKARQLNIN